VIVEDHVLRHGAKKTVDAVQLSRKSVQSNPPSVLTPATPRMLFGNGISDEGTDSDDDNYKHKTGQDIEEDLEQFEIDPSYARQCICKYPDGESNSRFG
jgi:hypothetical protein